MVSETVEGDRIEAPADLRRYPLGYRENSRRWSSLHRFEEGVVLDGDVIGWGEGRRKSLHAITTIRLRPFEADEGPKWACCDIRFDDGTLVAITSSGRHGAISNERNIAYAEFLHELHARFDAADRERIAFRDGIARTGRRMIFNALGVALPGTILGCYVAFSTGPIYYLGLSVFTLAVGTVLLYGGIKDFRSKVYSPDRVPAHALPPPPPPS